MSAERRGPAICNVSNIGEGKDEMTKASIDLQDLRRRIYVKAKAEPSWRFWGLNLINPMLRGWVNYFAVGHSSECFSFIKDWVEKKVRRHLAHARKRKGFDWERWNRRWLYDTLGLFNAYRVRRDGPKVAPAG